MDRKERKESSPKWKPDFQAKKAFCIVVYDLTAQINSRVCVLINTSRTLIVCGVLVHTSIVAVYVVVVQMLFFCPHREAIKKRIDKNLSLSLFLFPFFVDRLSGEKKI